MTGKPAARPPRPSRRALLAAGACALLGRIAVVRAGAGSLHRFDSGRLWRVERDGVPESYAFGTIHLADARVAEPSAAVLAALSRSRVLAMEVAVDAIVAPSTFDQEQLADGRKLESIVGAGTYARARRVLVERGMSERAIARMKPWAAMMAVASSSGPHDASLALDARLLAAARRAHLRVESLELIDEQIASFDAVPVESQVALLRHALDHPEALQAEKENMIQAWLKGDLAALMHFPSRMDSVNPGVVRHYDQLVRHIVYDRTVLMHHRLAMSLRGGRVFVAVGALHLQGMKGLLALIEEDGYRVTRIE